jgi:hypothetical protein
LITLTSSSITEVDQSHARPFPMFLNGLFREINKRRVIPPGQSVNGSKYEDASSLAVTEHLNVILPA